MIKKFRKKPIEIEAIKVRDALFYAERHWDDLPQWLRDEYDKGRVVFGNKAVLLGTLEGDMTGQFDDWIICGIYGEIYPCKPDIFAASYEDVEAYQSATVDMLLFCPNCTEQHIDEARPGVCERCGMSSRDHGCSDSCVAYLPWLNPPHRSHRCGYCSHVWRPADVPTNGVAVIQTKGKSDGSAVPFGGKRL